MGPVPAPFVDVAVHVVQTPWVGWVTADFCGPTERGPLLGPVIRFSLEVRLAAAERIAKRGGGRRAGPAGIFPLRFGREPELPIRRKLASLAAEYGELPAKRLGLGKVDIADRVVVSRRQL